MTNLVKNFKIGDNVYPVKDDNTYPSLTDSQKSTLLSDGTYLGNPVQDGQVFETSEGVFEKAVSINTISNLTWNTGASSAVNSYIAFGNGYFVNAAGYYSTDGATWVASSTRPSLENPASVAYGNGVFVISGVGEKPWYCTDPTGTWTECSSFPDIDISTGHLPIVYHKGHFTLFSNGTDCARSTDGISWSKVTLPVRVKTWSPVPCSNGEVIVAVCNSSQSIGTTDVLVSEDGKSWTRYNNVLSGYSASSIAIFVPDSIAAGNGLFILTGSPSGEIARHKYYFYSTDGIHWTEGDFGSNVVESTVAIFGDGAFLVFDGYTDNTYLLSSDGLTWTSGSYDTGSFDVECGCWGNSKFVITAYNAGTRVGTYTATPSGRFTLEQLSYSSDELDKVLKDKQDSIPDLNEIRSGATAGATSLQNSATGTRSLSILAGSNTMTDSVTIGLTAGTTGNNSTAVGKGAVTNGADTVALGKSAITNGVAAVAIGASAEARAIGAIMLGGGKNTDSRTLKVALRSSATQATDEASGLYLLLNSSGKIPAGRYTDFVGADGTNSGAAGSVPAPTATDNTKFLKGDGTWDTPTDTTYTAGTGISISSGVIAVASPTLTNTATGNYSLTVGGTALSAQRGVNVGIDSVGSYLGTSIGYGARTSQNFGTAVGASATSTAQAAIAIGNGCVNNDIKTLKVSLWPYGAGSSPSTDTSTNCYTLLKADGSIPKERFGELNAKDLLSAGSNIQITDPALNVLKQGDLTIYNGVIYGTGRNEYAYTSTTPITASDVCEVVCKIHTPSTMDTAAYPIFTFDNTNAIYLDNQLKFCQMKNGTRTYGQTTAQTSTDYVVKLTSDGAGNYSLYVNDNLEFTTTSSIISSGEFRIGNFYNGATWFHGEDGYIDLKETYMTKDGAEVWRGYVPSVISSTGGSGGVTSVNGQTGAVTLTASDVLQPTPSDAGKYITTDGTNVTWGSVNGAVNNRGMYTSGVIYNSGDVVRYYVNNSYSYFMCTSDNVTSAPTSADWVQFETNKVPFSTLSGYYPVLSYRYTSASGSTISNIGAVVSQSVSAYNNLPTIQTYSGELKLTSGGLTGNNSSLGDYTIVDGTTGLIPVARLGTVPATAGSSYYKITTDGQGGVTPSWSSSVLENLSSNEHAIAIGQTPTYFTTAESYVSIGEQAESATGAVTVGPFSWSDEGGTTVGVGSMCSGTNSVAIGNTTVASGARSIAIGNGATASANDAIMVGHGTNSTAGTMAVGLGTDLAPVTYTLLDANGNIPADRLGTLPAADGNYTLRLTIANGVPTLSWVAA